MSSIRLVWILVVCLTASCALSQPQKLSAYDVLVEYGFPVGLLPKGAIGYSLNRDTGEFAVYFDKSCSFDIESYSLNYKSTITGVISKTRLYKLKGVTVKVLLLWLNIVEVTRKADDILFSVGIASADFGVENFLESPQCGCGFDCNKLPLNGDSMSMSALLLLLLVSAPIAASGALTAYEMLESFHFPEGILPKGVTGYELERSSGKFRADLNGSCSFALEGSYKLSYQPTITGYISDGRLTELRGISVKVLFFWLNIIDVTRVGDDLYFSVGVASASFPLNNFFVSPQCGCGLDCDDFRIRQLKFRNPSLSSL
ncbi:hypothetical protein CR513_20056, partial [Mucuna pruriens]